MGKSRRNRSGAARRDPIAKPIKPPSDPELAALRETKILPVIRDLKSSNTKSRSSAAAAVSNIIQDARCRKLLLREQIVHTLLTQTITDASIESRAAGWGILQTIAQEEESDFGVHLFRLDILSAIEFATKMVCDKIQSKEAPFAKTLKAEKIFIASIAASLVSLLTALAEAGDDILVAISSNATVIHFLITLITYQSQAQDGSSDPMVELRTDSLACFMILCEDNEKLSKNIADARDETFVMTMMKLKDDVNGDGVLACAVLHNIFASLAASQKPGESTQGDDAILIPTLTKAIASFQPDQPVQDGGNGWSDPSEYQQLALETLAAIGTSLLTTMGGDPKAPPTTSNGASSHKHKQSSSGVDEEDDEAMAEADDDDDDDDSVDGVEGEEGEGNSDDDDDEMDQEEIEADMDIVTGGDGDRDGDEDIEDVPVLQSLLSTAVPELIRIASSQPTDEVSMGIQGRSLSALNNIAWSLSLFDFTEEHNAGIQKAWSPVAHSIWKTVISPILSSDTADVTLATQVTSLAWAIARVLTSKTPLQDEEQRKFITLYQATKGAPMHPEVEEDPFQSLGVKCIGVLGQLALDPCPEQINREIGTFLITVVASLPETPAAEAVEAFDQLFDIYGDENYAYDKSVFWAGNFCTHLDNTVSKARAMVKSIDKKAQPELRHRADEIVLNLTRFVAYKKKHNATN